MLEESDLRLGGAGERTALVAEQLAFKQRLDHRRTIHRHESPIGAGAERVQRVRDQLLAGPRFTRDQQRAHVRREAPDRVEQLLHGRAASDHAAEGERLGDLGVDLQQPLPALDALADARQQPAETCEIERLADVVERAQLHRLDGGVDAGWPVIRMIWHVGSMSRMARSTSSPLMSGILRSTITASGLSTGSSARAARASVRLTTVNPKRCANCSTMRQHVGLVIDDEQRRLRAHREVLDHPRSAAPAAGLPVERLTDFPAECVRGERFVQERDPEDSRTPCWTMASSVYPDM